MTKDREKPKPRAKVGDYLNLRHSIRFLRRAVVGLPIGATERDKIADIVSCLIRKQGRAQKLAKP